MCCEFSFCVGKSSSSVACRDFERVGERSRRPCSVALLLGQTTLLPTINSRSTDCSRTHNSCRNKMGSSSSTTRNNSNASSYPATRHRVARSTNSAPSSSSSSTSAQRRRPPASRSAPVSGVPRGRMVHGSSSAHGPGSSASIAHPAATTISRPGAYSISRSVARVINTLLMIS